MKFVNFPEALVVAMAALVVGNAAAETYTNYFAEGTEWYTSATGIDPEDGSRLTRTSRIWLEKAPEDWNLPEEGLVMYVAVEETDETYVAGFIKSEDEKVYFMNHPRFMEWLLLYDFSLTEGYVAEVAEMRTIWPNTYGVEKFSENCVGETSVEGWPELQAIKIEEDYNQEVGSTVWIRGIGSIQSPFKNCRYGRWIGSSSSVLEKVVHNGEVVYQRSVDASVAGWPSLESGDAVRYSIDGRRLNEPLKGGMYIENGKTYIR